MRKYTSSTHYIIASLIPYTEPNLKLVFRPYEFFQDVSRLHKVSAAAARGAYYRAIKQGLVEADEEGVVRLTTEGKRRLERYEPRKLKGASLMVVFDIPETARWKRDRFRAMLREFSFTQVQKSVWLTQFDCETYVKEELKDLRLDKEVKLFECRAIEIK